MLNYNHILYATDLDDCCKESIPRVLEFSVEFGAKVTIVHVVKSIPSTYGFAAIDVQVESDLVELARKKMDELISSFDIDKQNTLIATGQVTSAILDISRDLGCDAIMLNGHTHNVFARLISTEDSIVNHANCDVFILR